MSRPPRLTSSSRSNCSGGVFDWEPALRKLDELNARVEDPTLRNDPAEAQAVSREVARQQLKASKDRAALAELEALLSGEADGNDAFVEINSGAGGAVLD